jgi:hypothetical protein
MLQVRFGFVANNPAQEYWPEIVGRLGDSYTNLASEKPLTQEAAHLQGAVNYDQTI